LVKLPWVPELEYAKAAEDDASRPSDRQESIEKDVYSLLEGAR
jgi:hypothetical protein